VKLEDKEHLLIFDMHHIISDGVSMEILIREFTSIYSGANLDKLKIQYKDFSSWQNGLVKEGHIKKQEEFWLKRFEGEIPVLNMAYDYARPAVQSFEGGMVRSEVKEELAARLNRLAKETGTTTYMVLLAAYNVLLFKYTGQDDIVVGCPIAGRPHADLQNIIGMFVNTLAMRNNPTGDISFRSFLAKVKETVLDAFQNQDYQFEELVDRLNIRRDMSRNPLFDTMFSLQNMGKAQVKIEGLNFMPYEFDSKISKFDITLTASEQDGKIDYYFEYSTSLFKRETIEKLSIHFLNILEAIILDPDVKISDLDMLTQVEKKKLICDFNQTKSDYPKNKSIHGLFEKQARLTSKEIAVACGEQSLTYRQLNAKSNQLARVLRNKGVERESIVGIMADRSIEMVVGVLGILKAGGAYLPVDPKYPEDRIKFMLEDSETNILLMSSLDLKDIKFEGEVINLKDESIYSGDGSNLANEVASGNLAYVMYTSGSTGKPKGVMVEHMNVVRLVKNTNYVDFAKGDRILQTGAVVFDASTFEIWGALLNGLSLYLVDDEVILNPDKLGEVLEQYKITTLWLTSPLFNQLVQQKPEIFKPLKNLLVGGDILSPKHISNVRKMCKGIRIINGYGPTENTTFSCCFTIDKDYEDGSIPIGSPINNSTAYIVDKNLNLQPIRIPGELCVGGDGVARGYLNREELTKEKFVPDPFLPGKTMYRTGDLARWLPDGNIEFLGRIDNQVKIRGFRIELDEIEVQLLKHEAVKEAVVLVREDQHGNKNLCAYVACEKEIQIGLLREYLSKELPNYMVPAYFVPITKLPLTVNGKIDKKSLPEPSIINNSNMENYIPPRNEAEREFASAWGSVLGIDNISIYDNFFHLGGDSIKAVQVISMLKNYSIGLRDFLKYPVIAELSELLKPVNEKEAVDQAVVEGYCLLTPIQRWLFNEDVNEVNYFNQSVVLHNRAGFDIEILKKVFDKILEHHDALRMVYEFGNDSIMQFNRGKEGMHYSLEVFDFTDNSDYKDEVEAEIEILQSSIDLKSGPLVKLGLFKTMEGDHLLIVIHHLVVDGVSWRIILSDVISLYEQFLKNDEVKLPLKTHSFMEWAKRIHDYANSNKILNEIAYWKSIENQNVRKLPVDKLIDTRLHKDSQSVGVLFTEDETEKLLKQVAQVLKSEINEVLLTALGLSMKKWSGSDLVLINMEGHGREQIVEDIDITRTVGWFTSAYPVLLDLHGTEGLERRIRGIAAQLRNIPEKGIGYGVLKYLTREENKKGFKFLEEPEISFNYLGQFDREVNTELFKVSNISGGSNINPNMKMPYKLDINGMVINEKLSLNFGFNKNEYNRETIEDLAACTKKKILEIIALTEPQAGCESEAAILKNVQPYNDLFYKDCSYNSFFSICNYYDVDVAHFLLNDIISYHYDDNKSGVKLDVNYSPINKDEELLRKIGLGTTTINYSPNLIEDIKFSINEKNPVILSVDCFYSPIRLDMYKKQHWSHSLLVYGYDDLEEVVHVIEQNDINSLTYRRTTLSYQSLLEAYNGYITNFRKGEKDVSVLKFYKIDNWDMEISRVDNRNELILGFASKVLNSRKEILNGIDMIPNFMSDFKELIKDENEIKKNIKSILVMLNNIINSKTVEKYRIEKILMLEDDLTKMLDDVIESWDIIRRYMTKFIYSSKFSGKMVDACLERLGNIFDFEAQYNEKLMKHLEDTICIS
jgi:amino acid adenylation domain-containing protein/non-ribosomal peptide synthase protein (TIGR01720 family)